MIKRVRQAVGRVTERHPILWWLIIPLLIPFLPIFLLGDLIDRRKTEKQRHDREQTALAKQESAKQLLASFDMLDAREREIFLVDNPNSFIVRREQLRLIKADWLQFRSQISNEIGQFQLESEWDNDTIIRYEWHGIYERNKSTVERLTLGLDPSSVPPEKAKLHNCVDKGYRVYKVSDPKGREISQLDLLNLWKFIVQSDNCTTALRRLTEEIDYVERTTKIQMDHYVRGNVGYRSSHDNGLRPGPFKIIRLNDLAIMVPHGNLLGLNYENGTPQTIPDFFKGSFERVDDFKAQGIELFGGTIGDEKFFNGIKAASQ